MPISSRRSFVPVTTAACALTSRQGQAGTLPRSSWRYILRLIRAERSYSAQTNITISTVRSTPWIQGHAIRHALWITPLKFFWLTALEGRCSVEIVATEAETVEIVVAEAETVKCTDLIGPF